MINFDMMFKNLFIGSCPKTPVDVDRLHNSLKVTSVLNLQTDDDFAQWGVNWPAVEARYVDTGIACTRFPILDWHEDDLRLRLDDAAHTLAELIALEHRVYVHCTAGIGRAPATVMAYLAWHAGYSLDDAIDYVASRRKVQPYLEAIRDVDAQRVN